MILPLFLDRSPTFCSLKFRFLALLFKIFWGITKMWHKIITFDSLYCHCSVVQLCLTLGYPMDCRLPCPSPSPRACSNSCPLSWWCHPTIASSVVPFSCLQSFTASGSLPISWLCIKWPKYCSFSFSISPSNEYSGLISFRVDWINCLAVQQTLMTLFQHHSLKASVFQCSIQFSCSFVSDFETP